MTSLPDGVYRIDSTDLECATMMLPEQNVLRGEIGTGMKWTVRCKDQDKGLYTFESVAFGGYLGVNSLNNNQAVYRLDNSEQQWRLQWNTNGLSVSQASGGIDYFWYLGAVGEPVIIMDDSKGVIQSWTFKLADE